MWFVVVFFFKQKTAYELRISDWSSDVCSSDLFPVGTVLVKSFGWADVNGGRPVETRLLIHRASGWTALPYIWDADGKDATLALGGRRVPVSFKSPDGETHSIRYEIGRAHV